MALRLMRQRVFFLRKQSRVYLAQWTQYVAGQALRSELWVWKVSQLLFPPTRIGYSVQERATDVPEQGLAGWIREHGYTVVDSMTGPELDEPIGMW